MINRYLSISFILIIIVFFTLSLSAQTEEGFAMGLLLGTATFNGENFQVISLQPELTFGKFGIGLDLYFMFDKNFHLNTDNWDQLKDYYYKILYIKYGQKGEPLYTQIGMFKNATLGHGLIMSGYTNMLYFPEIRKLGFALDIDGSLFEFPYIGMESFIDNIPDIDIFGERFYVRPLAGLQIPIISKIELGTSFVTDSDPQETQIADISLSDISTSSVTIWGLDIEVPLVEEEMFSLITYFDWAQIIGKGNGWEAGFSSYFIKLIGFGGAVYENGDRFVGQYFDGLYDNYDVRNAKYASLDTLSSVFGWKIFTYLLVGEEIFKFYTELNGDFNGNPVKFIAALIIDKELLKIVSANFSFVRSGITTFGDVFNWSGSGLLNSYLNVTLNFHPGSMTTISLIHQTTWDISGTPKTTSTLQTSISF